MQAQDAIQFLLYDECLLRIPDPTFLPRRGTFFLARHLPLRGADRVLELGAGSGLVALSAARRGHQVVATDIVAECCECVRANALLNGVAARLEVRAGHLYDPVAGDRFDLVATNPPQMPTPADHRWDDAQSRADNGGLDGWELLSPIIEQAPAHLESQGRLVFTLFGFLGLERALDRLGRVGLRPAVLAQEEQPFPRIARERLAYLRTLGAPALAQGCPATCTRYVLCGAMP